MSFTTACFQLILRSFSALNDSSKRCSTNAFTQARTLDELTGRVKDAIELYLETEGTRAEGKIEAVDVTALRPAETRALLRELVRAGLRVGSEVMAEIIHLIEEPRGR